MKACFWLGLFAAGTLWLDATPTRADGPSTNLSYSIWTVDGPTVHVRFILPMAEAALLARGAPRIDAPTAAAVAGAQLGVRSSSGDCPALIQDQWVGRYYILAPAYGAYRFEMTFACPSADGLILRDRVPFAAEPGHVDDASVRIGRGQAVLETFTATHQDLVLPRFGQTLRGAGLASFARQGLERSLGVDALALVAGLLLLARRWRDLRDIGCALAVGYGIGLAIMLSGLVAPDRSAATAGAGFLVAVLGLCALRAQAGGAPSAPRWRLAMGACAGVLGGGVLAAAAAKGMAVGLAALGFGLFGLAQVGLAGAQPRIGVLLFAPAAVFGLLDGAVWAQALQPLQMPGLSLTSAMLGYDLGAFLGLAAAAAGAMAGLWALRRWLRPLQLFAEDLAAAALTGIGLFWFVSRLYGA